MEPKNYLKDIGEIKNLMNRSSRFISLSGLSGIFAGLYAIIGGAVAYFFLFPKNGEPILYNSWELVILLLSIFFLSVATAFLFTTQKAKKNREKIWDATTRRLLFNFLVPFATGGIYILIQLNAQHYGLTASLMLVFYGLALVNASKYTIGNIKYLGFAQIILGLICATLPNFGFWFWIFGFGICHVVYGTVMYFQEKNA